MTNTDLADAIRAVSGRIGIDPLDFATAISYETGGTFNPAIRGGAGNRHIGLIQFGIPEQQRYGVTQATPGPQQVEAAGRYLVDRGVRQGMGLADVYSAINAGRVGRYNASDAANGGAPGTVMDKVTQQMGAHREKAAALLGGTFAPSATAPGAGRTPQAGTDLAAALPGATLPALAGGRELLPQAGVGAASEPADPLALTPTSSLADAFANLPAAADAAGRQQRQQAEQQRRQALLSVNAFGR